MYIQLTTRCNMLCAHCCMSATHIGQDMPYDIWQLALKLTVNYGHTIQLGGGEPTLNPEFMRMLGDAIIESEEELVPWLATNGSQTEIALKLAKLAKRGVISCALSQDPWHSKIDSRVVKAFKLGPNQCRGDHDYREIRDVSKNGLSRSGRAIENEYDLETEINDRCPCDDMFIRPDGSIRFCGCLDAPEIGHVTRGLDHEYEDLYENATCWHQVPGEDQETFAA